MRDVLLLLELPLTKLDFELLRAYIGATSILVLLRVSDRCQLVFNRFNPPPVPSAEEGSVSSLIAAAVASSSSYLSSSSFFFARLSLFRFLNSK